MGDDKWDLIHNAEKFDFPVHKPYYELTDKQKQLIWTGNEYFKGLNKFLSILSLISIRFNLG